MLQKFSLSRTPTEILGNQIFGKSIENFLFTRYIYYLHTKYIYFTSFLPKYIFHLHIYLSSSHIFSWKSPIFQLENFFFLQAKPSQDLENPCVIKVFKLGKRISNYLTSNWQKLVKADSEVAFKTLHLSTRIQPQQS